MLESSPATWGDTAETTFHCKEGGGMIIYVLAGDVAIRADFFERRMSAHDLLTLLNGNEIDITDTSKDFRAFLISYDASTICDADLRAHLRNTSGTIGRNPVLTVMNPAHIKLLESYCGMLQEINSRPRMTFRAEIVKNMLEAVLFAIDGIYRDYFPRHESDTVFEFKHERKDEMVNRFQSLVSSHYMTERSTAFYADALCITPKHLAVIVKAVSGRTPSEVISRAVMADAKSKLKSTGMSVAEISDSLNFPNPSFFCKYFRRHAGCSPKSYRDTVAIPAETQY